MSPAGHAAPDIEATAVSLREELARLEIQKRALERELAAVGAHLGSVRQTLDALRDLVAPAPAPLSGAPGRARRTYGGLTDRIMEYFAAAGTADVRARDVAAALGRDTDSGSINAVRSALDRLVGAGRLHRTGRGLYRAGGS